MRRSWESFVVVHLALACFLTSAPAHAQARLEKAAQVLEQQARTGKGEFINFLIGAASAFLGMDVNVSVTEAPVRPRESVALSDGPA